MKKDDCSKGMRVMVNENIGQAHKERLVPGMIGTVFETNDKCAVIEFDQPFMRSFADSYHVALVCYERLDPAPEGASDFVELP